MTMPRSEAFARVPWWVAEVVNAARLDREEVDVAVKRVMGQVLATADGNPDVGGRLLIAVVSTLAALAATTVEAWGVAEPDVAEDWLLDALTRMIVSEGSDG